MDEELDESEIHTGTVLWFLVDRGYGFIAWSKGGQAQKDMFIYYSDIVAKGFKQLKPEQKVQFRIGKNNSGAPKAIDLIVIG